MSESNIDAMRKEYDKQVAEVGKTAPNTPERWTAMQDKKEESSASRWV